MPEILGGSADLTPSNLTFTSSSKSIINGSGNYIHYGVREFGMSAIMNGITLYGLNIPYGQHFLFSQIIPETLLDSRINENQSHLCFYS